MRPLVVAIAGGSGSGKTTIASAFAARTGALLLSHDWYYRDVAEPGTANFDHPDALETTLLVAQLTALKAGESVDGPDYDFATHRRVTGRRLRPRPTILVEGILVLSEPAVCEACDLTVFVSCPDDVRLARRMVRDCEERGRSVRGVVDQYLVTVRRMHERFVAPCEGRAQLVLDGMGSLDEQVDRLIAAAELKSRSR